ncbi:GGDEF domain-containing protein [Niveibacterium sp. SC-1]|uniref:GGDEF domain-containing protein n=1 Tax=Niveibacterium sp. SC-1 TaxID=3135646 RepID=UPI00312012A4
MPSTDPVTLSRGDGFPPRRNAMFLGHSLRRFGLGPVVLLITLAAIGLSLIVALSVHYVVLGITMPPLAWGVSIACPLVIAPLMSWLLLRLAQQLDLAREQLHVLSLSDQLTETYNRRHFMDRVREEMQRAARSGQSFSLAFIDIDDFKLINDSYGHLSGDDVLRGLALACKQNIRQCDVFARIGGEEFAVLLPMTEPEEACLQLERLRAAVEALEVPLADRVLRVTVSIGVSSPRGRQRELNSLLREADEALYAAKRRGKNCVVFEPPAVESAQAGGALSA